MKHVGRILIAVLVVFVPAVVWYALAGEAVAMRRVFTNAEGITEETVWVRSDKGLYGGPVTAIASLPSDGAIVYAGTREDEIYASSDGGSDWTPLGGASSGHFVSRDGGGTWKAIVLPFGSQSMVTGTDIDPAEELRLAVTVTGGDTGLSKDGGRTWAASRKGSLPSDWVAVQFLPDGAPGLAIGTQSRALYFSEDGLDWQLTFQSPDGGHVFGLDRSSTGVLAATSHGVFSSGDGTAWSESSTGITNLTLAGLAASPVDADVLYAATDQEAFRSPDAGISWSRCSKSKRTLSVLVLEDGRTVLAGTSDGFVLRSADAGDHWVAVTRGVPGVRVSILASRATGPTMVYVGTDDGFAVSSDAGLTWEPRNIGLVATTPGYRVVSPTPRTEIAVLLPDADTPGTVILSLLGQGLYITRDDGNRWKPLQSSIGTPWVDSLAVDDRTSRLYAGTDTEGVVVLQDGGTRWSRSSSELSTILSVSGAVNTIAVARDGIVYAGTQARGAAVSRDQGAT